MKAVAVFCGANSGRGQELLGLARQVGGELAKREWTLVYGGAQVGMMGALADAALGAGGQVVGVMPRFMQAREVAHTGLSKLYWSSSMHERKQKMFELADAFVALPGGFGTMDEIFEILTWKQLGLHDCPVAFLNHDGYYDSLRAGFDQMQDRGLLQESSRALARFEDSIGALLDWVSQQPPGRKGDISKS